MEENIKRIVVKVGTNVLTNKDNRIQGPILRELVRQIAVLYERDIQVILVSSGSAIAGIEILEISGLLIASPPMFSGGFPPLSTD